MGEILSQDEVDALLSAVETGTVPTTGTAAGAGPSSVRAVDLTNLAWSVEARLPGLKPLAERFARAVRVSLGTFFGQLPQVTPRPLQLAKFGPFLERIPAPVCLPLFRLSPLRGHGMVVVAPALVGSLLEVFFGGNAGRKTPAPARGYSAIEQRVVERLARRVLADLRQAWAPVGEVECGFVRAETNPHYVAVAAPHDVVLLLELDIAVEGSEGVLTIVIPNTSLDPMRSRLQVTADIVPEAPDAAWSERLRGSLAQAEVEVAAELGTQRLSMRQVLALKVGDVIPLPTGREGPVLLKVEGRPRFTGAPGVSGGQNAVRVTAAI